MATWQISLHFVLMFIKKVNENCIFLSLLTALQEGGVGERGGGGGVYKYRQIAQNYLQTPYRIT